MKSELEIFINNNLEAFDKEMPDPAILEMIQGQMRKKAKKKGILIPMQTIRWAAACFILLAGACIFQVMQKKTETKTMVTKITEQRNQKILLDKRMPDPSALANNPAENKILVEGSPRKITELAKQEHGIRKQILFAKLNDMESPSVRLAAVAQASQLTNTDNEIVDVLVRAMNTDPSTNVRLAALESLSRFYREKYVKKQLIASLQKQKDPLVQIGLIELLTRMREKSILDQLDKIINDGNTLEAVKGHAYSSLFTLRS